MLSKFNKIFPGTVYLEGETKPSQHVSTSSDVSVKLEVEDRKRGPSQLSDSFETSPSDLQVDPRPKKDRCEEKNQQCQYMTFTAKSEQRGTLTTPDYYSYYGSPATTLCSQPAPLVDSTSFFTTEATMKSSSNVKLLKKRVSIACVKCRDRKVKVRLCGMTLNRILSFSCLKCIPGPFQEPPRCTRCIAKNQTCQYMTVTAQSEQRGSLTMPEQTDCYPHYESGPVHPPPATPLYSQPPPVDSTYPYPQQPFYQPYSTSTYQMADHQNPPPLSFSPLSSGHQASSYAPPRQAFPYPSSPIRSRYQIADRQILPRLLSHPRRSDMSFGDQAFSYGPPCDALPFAQLSSPIRSGQDTSGTYGTDVNAYFESIYQARDAPDADEPDAVAPVIKKMEDCNLG